MGSQTVCVDTMVAKDRKYAGIAGVVAAAVALGVGELIGLVVSARSAPLVAVGGVVIDNVPEWGKNFAIQVFGTHDKLALQVGTVIVLALIAGGVGVGAWYRLWIGYAGIGVFGAVGVVAALTRAGANVAWALPSLVGAAAAAVALRQLLGYLNRTESARRVAPMGASERRTFLKAVGATLGGAALVGIVGRTLGERSSVNNARTAVTLPTPSGTRAASPAGSDVGGLNYVVSNADFYRIDTALVVPRVDPADWTLKIHGRVRTPITMTFADLLKRPMIERYITLSCVSNEVGGDLIGNAKWLGVPLKDLLEEAGPEDGADQVVSRSVDGFTAGTPTKVLLDGRDAIIAVAMNGEPLPIDHGFPARMVVPGLYGYVSATKWLAELELTTFADFDAYWIPRGWAQMAPIKTESRIDKPRAGSISAGQTVIAGVAWAPHRGISKVEVRLDNGDWQTATLASVASVDTWRLWSLPWNATPGNHSITVRATDNAGDTQTEATADPAPDGATGWHRVGVTVNG